MSPASRGSLGRVAVALDTSDWKVFRAWCRRFGPRVGVLKVGLEAYLRWGRRAVEEALTHAAMVFLDLKLHDIPSTVAAATEACRDIGASYLSVHAGGGEAMLQAAVGAAQGRIRIVAVTLLTHLDTSALRRLEMPGESSWWVRRWAALARHSGCAGVVCSPLETQTLRRDNPPPFLLITPGIRWGEAIPADQSRVGTPRQALEAGADLLVVGRPLTRAADPEAALAELARQLQDSQ